MRVRPWADWRWSNCGESGLRILSRFHTTDVASKALPSWNLTFGRSLKVHLVLSFGSTLQAVARPGTSVEGLSAWDRSHSSRLS